MAVKFSQFNVETDVANVGYLVGYDGTDNVQITPANLISSSSIIDGSGTATKLPKWVDAETLTDSILTEDSTGFITVGGNFVISGTTGDTLTLIKSTTEPSLRIEGDTNKDFVITISGELLTFTQDDGTTDILTLDHDTGNAVLNGGSLSINRSTTNSEAGIIDFDSGGFEFTADAAGTGYPITFNGGTSGSVAELMRIEPGGNVGIGTDAPSSDAIVRFLEIEDSGSTSAGVVLQGAAKYSMYSSSSSTLVFRDETNAASRMIVDSSGNVGIGTTTIRQKLHQHVDDSGANYHAFTNTGTGTGASDGFVIGINADEEVLIWNHENTDMVFATNNAEKMRIESGGNVGIGTDAPADTLTVSGGSVNIQIPTGSLKFNEGVTNGFSLESNGANGYFKIRDTYNSVDKLYIDQPGNVGIGTTSPTAIAGYTTLEINNATTGGILDLSQGDVMRGRLVATTSSLSLETSGSIPHYFYLNGQNRLHLHTDGTVEASYINTGAAGFYFNGISQVGNSGTVAGNATVSLTFTNVDDSSLYIECVFNHYGYISTYGCSLVALFANGPNLSSQEIQRTDSANGGAWSISKTNNTTFVVAKSAGTYAGAGAWYVKINGNRVYAA
tara:strand:- start:489 stop:2333 length:1845 start_codon:yes stop_codon:yes gene_type:complete